MSDQGIDYGLGQANIDLSTGIRYGVIHQNVVLQAWADSSEPNYGKAECECGQEYDANELLDNCTECGDDLQGLLDCAEPVSFYFEDEGYEAESDSQGDIFVMKSPFYTFAQFCSPCAPGALHLENPLEKGSVKGYCFGHDWFEDKAPYTVYDVKTNKVVEPKPFVLTVTAGPSAERATRRKRGNS